MRADFADGVVFVPLEALSEPALVGSSIARALGMREAGRTPLPQRLQDYLGDRALLLVLDNCEHLPPVAPLAATLLAGCPR